MFGLVPFIVLVLIIASWILSLCSLVSFYISGGIELAATLFGGYTRFVTGFRDLYHRKITFNVSVTVTHSANDRSSSLTHGKYLVT